MQIEEYRLAPIFRGIRHMSASKDGYFLRFTASSAATFFRIHCAILPHGHFCARCPWPCEKRCALHSYQCNRRLILLETFDRRCCSPLGPFVYVVLVRRCFSDCINLMDRSTQSLRSHHHWSVLGFLFHRPCNASRRSTVFPSLCPDKQRLGTRMRMS